MEIFIQEEPPKTLYHYTSVNVFKSIIDNEKIRATRYNQMNDNTEIDLGIDKIVQSLEDYNPKPKNNDEYMSLRNIIINHNDDSVKDIFIFSLSAAINSLDQWRAYCANGGVAIGINASQLKRCLITHDLDIVGKNEDTVSMPSDPKHGFRLERCKYTDPSEFIELDNFINDIFSEELFHWRKQIIKTTLQNKMNMPDSLWGLIYEKACTIKHNAYSSEQEWRCVCKINNQKTCKTLLNENDKEHIELIFERPFFIDEVWISPHGPKEDIKRAVEFYKKKYDLNYEIIESDIPFRG